METIVLNSALLSFKRRYNTPVLCSAVRTEHLCSPLSPQTPQYHTKSRALALSAHTGLGDTSGSHKL